MRDILTSDWPFQLGKVYKFFGVDNLLFKLDRKVFEAQEDPDDRYQSYLGSVEVTDLEKTKKAIFFRRALDTVQAKKNHFGGFNLVSTKDKHIWLSVGTDFFFNYIPRRK